MSADFEIILDECLAQLKKGESLDAGLGDHSAMADELRPLLALAAGLRAAPPPRASTVAVADGKQKMLAAFAAQGRRQVAPEAIFNAYARRIRAFLRLGTDTDVKYVLRFAVGILLVLVFGASGVLAAASTDSLPGDALYPVKQSVEGLRLSLTFSGQARQTLTEQLNVERLEEIRRLLALHRQGIVDFDGLLQAQDGNQWTVSGLTLHLSDATTIESWPAVGTRIRVLLQVGGDGALTALRIRLSGSGPDRQGGGFISPLSSPFPVPPGTPTPTGRQNSTPQPGPRTQDGPLSTDWRTYEPWSEDWQTHEPWSGDRQTHEPMPTSWPGHDDMSGTGQTDHAVATPWPTHDSMATDHANPTARPTRSSMMTPQPHQPMPTQPSHQSMPTAEPSRHDGGSMPTQPPHRDYQQGGGGSDSDGQH